MIVKLEPNGPVLPADTQAQAYTIDELYRGLDYPVQGRAYQIGKFLLPVWTDGDGYFYAINRDGKCIAIA